MEVPEPDWKPSATPIDARRAPVTPRACLHPGQTSLPIDQQIRKLLDKRVAGAVCLAGESGSGKTTALLHLAAALGDEVRITLVDRPLAGDRPPAHPGQLVVYTSHVPADPGRLVLLKMSPWGTDDLIEYLLATHPGRCRSVMDRVNRNPRGFSDLRGLPELWHIALDEMAADDAVLDFESAFHRHLSRSLLTPEDWDAAGQWCLATIAPWGRTWVHNSVSDPHVGRLIRHRNIATLLAAMQLARTLAQNTTDAELRGTLPDEFIDRCGLILPQFPAALERLKDLVSGDDAQVHSMAASLLHAAGDPWRPFQRPGMDLSYARLGGAQWPGAELPESRLVGAQFAGALLDEAELRHASLERARLANASLRKANLTDARCVGADLSGADLGWALAVDARFTDADLTATEFHRAVLRGSRFRGARLKGTAFVAADLSAADFRHALLDDTDFTGSTLDRARLPNQSLKSCTLDGARLTNADLRRCDLEGKTVSGADFSGAKFNDSLLTGSVLKHCKLYKADLRSCGLADINWEGADLRKADLRRSTFHMGSTRSGLVGSTVPCEGSRTGFYTDDFQDRHYKNPEEIRRANLRHADLRGAKIEYVDFYLVDLRNARYSKKQRQWFARCGALLGE
jgi:uncharacterized protein YjbI with pentapeptide repeats